MYWYKKLFKKKTFKKIIRILNLIGIDMLILVKDNTLHFISNSFSTPHDIEIKLLEAKREASWEFLQGN